MADAYTSIWTTDGTGAFTVVGAFDDVFAAVTDADPDAFVALERVMWQDPEDEDGVDPSWPMYETQPLRVRAGTVTAVSVPSAGTAPSIHRARAHALR
jgi:hypothetical protein